MKKLAAALILLLSAGIFGVPAASARDAQVAANAPRSVPFRAYGINRPLFNRAPVLQRNHSFHRTHRHGWRNRHHHRFTGLPVITGPVVIYQNGDIGIPPYDDDITASIPAPPVQPVVYRAGTTGGCSLQIVPVRAWHGGRTTVNVTRC